MNDLDLSTIRSPHKEHELQEMALALAIAMNVNVMVWGPPGAGKSDALKTIAHANNFHLEIVFASTKDPNDIAGVPFIHQGTTLIAPPDYARKIVAIANGNEAKGIKPRESILCWEEYSTALPSVQAATLGTILDKKAGPLQMPLGTRMIAIANPPKIAANGWDLSAPSANRFTHLDWTIDAETMSNGFVHGWKPVNVPFVPKNPQEIKTIVNNAKIIVGSFIKKKPIAASYDFNNFVGNSSVEDFKASDLAFPSSRSWEMAAKLYAGSKVARTATGEKLPDRVIDLLLEGTVGVAMATAFLSYARTLDLPDPVEVLNNPQQFTIPKRGDQIMALLGSVQNQAQLFSKSEKFPLIWRNWGDVICRIIDAGNADAALTFAQTWQDYMPPGSTFTSSQSRTLNAFMAAFGNI